MRSALAFDIRNIMVDEFCADLYNFKTINAAKDAIFKLNIIADRERKELTNLKKKMPIFATALATGEGLDRLKKEKVFCLVLGEEAHGLADEIMKMADGAIKIKMSGKIESINVASASAIIFHYIF